VGAVVCINIGFDPSATHVLVLDLSGVAYCARGRNEDTIEDEDPLEERHVNKCRSHPKVEVNPRISFLQAPRAQTASDRGPP
jgi:hypothetical protein